MNTLLLLLMTLFTQGNEHYAAGEWDEAVSAYEQCLNDTASDMFLTDVSRAEVYYNLGNARFRQGELSQAILAYERCLRLQPRHKDARYNLAFARSKIIDNIEDNRNFFLLSWWHSFRDLTTCRTWTLISILSFSLMLISFLLFGLGWSLSVRKTAFYSIWVMLLVSVVAGVNASLLNRRDVQRADAIVTQGVLNAKASPDRSGTDLFTLHEGTKVEIQETLGEWANIRVGNNEGWVNVKHIERI